MTSFESNPAFEPELIRNVLNDTEEYNEDLRERLAASPVFERALTLQQQFSEVRVKKEDLQSAWIASKDLLLSLDEQANIEGANYEAISMKGEGIKVPKFEMDFAAGVALMSLLDKETQQKRSFEHYLNPDEFRGTLCGFTLRFEEADEESAYVPVLAYQVSMSVADSPYGQVALYATGDVGKTSIQFDSDERLEQALPLLEKLFTLCSDRASAINRINMTLVEARSPDASSMRHVGYHVEKLINSISKNRRQYIEGALADLIGHYIKSSSYSLTSQKFSLSPEEGEEEITHYQLTDDEILSLSSVCLDVVFLDQTIVQGDKTTYRDRRSVHLVFPNGKGLSYVPLVELKEFTKQ